MRSEIVLWFIECSHDVDMGWNQVEVTATYEHASQWRRFEGYRPLPLVMAEGWTNDVWYRPVYREWESFLEEEECLSWDEELFMRRLEQAEIYAKAMVTP